MNAGALLSVEDLAGFAQATPGKKLAYGGDPNQFGELSLPAGNGPHPVIINVHGGAWRHLYSLDHTRALAQAFAQAGYAVWNIEYRRVGNEGGGWPGTFLDVAAAADHLRVLAREFPLDLSRVAVVGHSAGGHLALWIGARSRLPAGTPLYSANPLRVRGVIALAPATDLEKLHALKVRDHVVDKLVGGSPAEFPERYDWAMPSRLMPLGLPQHVIVGSLDAEWGHNSESYAAAARRAGDPDVELTIVPGAGHFEAIAPRSVIWPLILERLQSLLA